MRRFAWILPLVVLAGCAAQPATEQPRSAADAPAVSTHIDPQSGFRIYTITHGDTMVKFAPEAGANLFSINYKGRQLLHHPENLSKLPGFKYGIPVLYPSPNRVEDSQFTFRGMTFKFPSNDGDNFIHGLVHSAPWKVTGIESGPKSTTIHTKLEFKPGTPWYTLFPLKHTLRLDITIRDGLIRYQYTVDNSEGGRAIPYGFALHPYFNYLGGRESTYLKVPAQAKMVLNEELLPTGELVSLDEAPKVDLRQPRSLKGFTVDMVYYGAKQPQNPPVIDYRDIGLKVALPASEQFNYIVLYTPPNTPFFAIENQTMATDAHNLYTQGMKEISGLLIVEPGSVQTGWVEYHLKDYTMSSRGSESSKAAKEREKSKNQKKHKNEKMGERKETMASSESAG